MAYPWQSKKFGDPNNDKIEIELTNGITGNVNASIDIKVGGRLRYFGHGNIYTVECSEVRNNFNRQCYECFFCHNIEGCFMMKCNPDNRKDKKYVKFKIIK